MKGNYVRYIIEKSMKRILNQWGNKDSPFYLAHGNFPPLQCFLVAGNLYLYDWGHSFEDLLVEYKVFHFAIQCAWLVEGKDFSKILNIVKDHLDRTRVYWQAIKMKKNAWLTAFEFYLLERLVFLGNEDTKGVQFSVKFLFLLEIIWRCFL